jgi:hypothetical protein
LALFLKSCALAAILLAATGAPALAAQTREQVAAAVDRYLALREVAFSTHAEDVEVQARPGEEQVYGVIVEYQVEDALVTVVGFASGDASVYRSTGGGKIGGRGEPLVASAAWSLVKQAQVQLIDLPLVKDYPTPEPGHVRIYALTTAGRRKTARIFRTRETVSRRCSPAAARSSASSRRRRRSRAAFAKRRLTVYGEAMRAMFISLVLSTQTATGGPVRKGVR